MEEVITLTDHARKRLKQRLKAKGDSTDDMAIKAYFVGLKISEMKGNLKRWAAKETIAYKSKIRVLNQYAYFFHDTTLRTVFPVPQNLRNLANKLQKKKFNK